MTQGSFDRLLSRTVDVFTTRIIVAAGGFDYLNGRLTPNDSAETVLRDGRVGITILTDMIFLAAVDNFNAYLAELISEIMDAEPRILFGKKFDAKLAYEYDDIHSLRQAILERHVTDLGYQSIDSLSDFFAKNLGLSALSSKLTRLRLNRYIQIRNIIAHNRSVVNKIYLARSGSKSDVLGAHVKTRDVKWCLRYLTSVARNLHMEACEKFLWVEIGQ